MNKSLSNGIKLMLLTGLAGSWQAHAALQSIKLQDTIAQGSGMINVLTKHSSSKTTAPITGQTLQAFRDQHNNQLAFVVDVNEAANNTEKAASQGVAIEGATLIFNIANTEYRCNLYTTNTASMLVKKGETTRRQYPTLLGATGSNLITPSTDSDLYGTDFSAILRMRLDNQACDKPLPNLSNLTSAFLNIQFLDTDVKKGDPEDFYDFSNGAEDIALISIQDVAPVEALQAGVAEAPLVIATSQVVTPVTSWQYYPSDGSYYVVSYEDRYPNRGDYDFNDLVVGYRVGFGMVLNETTKQYEVNAMVATGYMIARGAEYTHDWYLRIPVNSAVQGTVTKNLFKENSAEQVANYPVTEALQGRINIQVLKDTKQLMSVTGSTFVNTLANQSPVPGKKFSIAINFDTPVRFSEFGAPPFDPYLYVINTSNEIHLSGLSTQISGSANSGVDSQFKDAAGYPYAMLFPDDWYPPLEGTDVGLAYTKFYSYITSPNTTNETWYQSPTLSEVKQISKSFWNW